MTMVAIIFITIILLVCFVLFCRENLIHWSLRIIVGEIVSIVSREWSKKKEIVVCHEGAEVFLLFLSSLGTQCKINLCELSSENKTRQDDELSCVKPIAGETRF